MYRQDAVFTDSATDRPSNQVLSRRIARLTHRLNAAPAMSNTANPATTWRHPIGTTEPTPAVSAASATRTRSNSTSRAYQRSPLIAAESAAENIAGYSTAGIRALVVVLGGVQGRNDRVSLEAIGPCGSNAQKA